MTIRPAEINDLPQIVDIYNSIIPLGYVTADIEPVSVASRQTWFHEHVPGKRPIWVVEENNEIIAYLNFRNFYGRPGYDITAEMGVYIRSDQRGKGLGKHLVKFAIEQAPACKIETLLAIIFKENETSMKLFKQMGFEEWGCLQQVARNGSKRYSSCILGFKTEYMA